MIPNETDLFIADAFDDWLKSNQCGDPPADLRDRCRETIRSCPVASRRRPPSKASWPIRTLKISAALAAGILALIVYWGNPWNTQSLFAESIRAMQQAPAIHTVESSTDTKRPGELQTSETWVLRGTGYRYAWKKNGKHVGLNVDDLRTSSSWDAEANEVRIEPSQLRIQIEVLKNPDAWNIRVQGFEYRLREHERLAKEAGVPIDVEEVREGSLELRRIAIGEVRFGDSELGQMVSLIVDIDKRTQRVVRFLSTTKSYGDSKLLPDGRRVRIEWGNENFVSETRIDYPDPASVDKSLFVFEIPEGAQVIRDDVPGRVRQDELKLKSLHEAITDYRSKHDNRFPKDWVKELLPCLDYNNSDLISWQTDVKKYADPNYTSWRFTHGGENFSDLKDPDQTAIAEFRHPWGYHLRLFASGRTEVRKL